MSLVTYVDSLGSAPLHSKVFLSDSSWSRHLKHPGVTVETWTWHSYLHAVASQSIQCSCMLPGPQWFLRLSWKPAWPYMSVKPAPRGWHSQVLLPAPDAVCLPCAAATVISIHISCQAWKSPSLDSWWLFANGASLVTFSGSPLASELTSSKVWDFHGSCLVLRAPFLLFKHRAQGLCLSLTIADTFTVPSCCGILVEGVLYLFMLWNIYLMMQRHVSFFYDAFV